MEGCVPTHIRTPAALEWGRPPKCWTASPWGQQLGPPVGSQGAGTPRDLPACPSGCPGGRVWPWACSCLSLYSRFWGE